MSDFIKITVKNIDPLVAFMKTIPANVKPVALNAFVKYVMGDNSGAHGLRHYPPYQSPTYTRTYKLRNGWYSTPAEGARAYIRNDVSYAMYPMGEPPTRVMQKIGWKSAIERILSNMAGGIRSATFAVERWIKEHMPK